MATLNNLVRNVTTQMSEQSVSWGSLILLFFGLGVVIAMMINYSQIAGTSTMIR